MKKIPTITALGILTFIAGHYWVTDGNKGASTLILFPVLLGVIFILSSICVLFDAD